MSKLTQSHTWKELLSHYETIKDLHMRDMFESDKKRFDKHSLSQIDMLSHRSWPWFYTIYPSK